MSASNPTSTDAEAWVERAARTGLVAFGLVHLVLGWLAAELALGDREGSASTTGAFQQLTEQPLGVGVVWAVAVGMALLAGWQAVEASSGHRDRDGSSRTRHRLISAGRVVAYLVLAFSAVQVATGSSGGSGGGTDSMTARLLDLPGGQVIVALVGIGVIAVGVGLIRAAWKESYLEDLDGQGRAGTSGTAYRWLGRLGHVAKGVALGLVGGFFGYAAITHDASQSAGMDQALLEVRDQPGGPVLLGVIALGFAGYGVFCLAQARHLDR